MENIVLTGYEDIDYLLKGFRDSQLILVSGRPGMGKTAFILSVARHTILVQNTATVIFSLEMPKEQVLRRIKNMGWTASDKLAIDDTTGIEIDELADKCRKLKEEKQIGLIIIDYLQLIECKVCSDVHITMEFKMSSITQRLKRLAVELGVPIVVTCQHPLNAELRNNRRPILQDLRYIGAIEQDMDTIMFLYRDECYDDDTAYKGIAEVNIAKARSGYIGTVELAFLHDKRTFAGLVTDIYTIEIIGSDIRQIESMDFQKELLKMFLLRGYDLMDEKGEIVNGCTIKIYILGKQKDGIWKNTHIMVKTINRDVQGLSILYWDKYYDSYKAVLEKIGARLEEMS